MKKTFNILLSLTIVVLTMVSFIACSSEMPVDNGKKAEDKHLSGPIPASVEVKIVYGHLHGYTGFHENARMAGTTFITPKPTFKFRLENNQWVADKNNPKYLYAFSSNSYFNTEGARAYALDIHYFDANGKDITAEMVANGKEDKLQHFFVPEDVKPLNDFDKNIDNPNNNDFFRYDYIDPTPFGKTMHDDNAKYNGLKNPMGFKGYMTFGYSRQTFKLAVKLMEAKGKKDITYKKVDFITNDHINEHTHNYKQVASWTPTKEQKEDNLWYPTFYIPVMVYACWGEEYSGDVEMGEDGSLPKIETLEPKTQRLIKTIQNNLGLSYKEIIENLYYQLKGDANPEAGTYWF